MTRTSSRQSPRKLAIVCLADWMNSGKPIQTFIESTIHGSGLQQIDRQLAVMLVLGCIRRQQYLDTLLASFSKTPLRKMKPLTLAALRVGIFQICFLQRIPDSAAVNETVKALKKCRQPAWLIRFVNGTLRAVSRKKESLPGPETAGPDGTPIPEHPQWLTRRWSTAFGSDTMAEICRVNKLEPTLCLQTNTSQTTSHELATLLRDADISSRTGRYAPDSLILPEYKGAVTSLPGFDRGLFQIQDQAARLACLLCSPLKKNGRYLDCCAGLGGKTCTLALQLPDQSTLVAVEPDKRRNRLLADNLNRQQLQDRVSCIQQTLQQYAATRPDSFDGILLDAPCSGTGVIRRHPDIRWNRRPEDIDTCQKTQGDLLQTAAALVAPGGFLIYATCSLEPEENQHVIQHFLSKTADFSLENCHSYLPDNARHLVDANGCFAPLPAEDIEGFFAARLVKKS